jgi:hypothetical protein
MAANQYNRIMTNIKYGAGELMSDDDGMPKLKQPSVTAKNEFE